VLFDEFDTDSSGTIDAGEVQALLLGLRLGGSDDALAVDRATVDLWFQVDLSEGGGRTTSPSTGCCCILTAQQAVAETASTVACHPTWR
jgi:hypothetical protein